MQNYTRTILYAIMLMLTCVIATRVSADGFLLPIRQPVGNIFSVKYHHVDVSIDGQAATTKVDQVFHNDTNVDEEGTYIFPLPKGASISKFTMFIGEVEANGKILDRDEARKLYESVVRRRKDPALLEYMDHNTFQARVYPIPANGDKRIRLSYNEVLQKNGTLCKYVYPLSTERFSSKPLQDVRVTIHIKSPTAVSNIYSPTHTIKVEQTKPNEAIVTWTAKDVKPDEDLALYFSQAKGDVALDVLSYKESSKQGYFMLLASPQVDDEKKVVRPRNVVFVLDRTGSMAGDKIVQAKGALKYCLNSLHPQDKFNVISFNESPDAVWDNAGENLVAASKANINKALEYASRIDASGGTNLNAAVIKALKSFGPSAKKGGNPDFVVLITDGLPTVGEQNIETILKNAKDVKSDARVFSFGVGYDVNTHLLDLMTEQSGGKSEYVLPNEDIESVVSTFFNSVGEPELTDVSIKASGVKILDMFPSNPLPDLFKGSQMIILGKYDGTGSATFTLSGTASNGAHKWETTVNLSDSNTEKDFIPQIWAARKIGFLLDQVRLHRSDELIKEIILLSKEWGIPTEFTSFLVEEPLTPQLLNEAITGAKSNFQEARKSASGQWSVTQSMNSSNLKDRAQVQASVSAMPGGMGGGRMSSNARGYVDSEGNTVAVDNIQNIGARTFYQRNNQWVDAQVEGKNLKSIQIKQYSDAHFKLLAAYPELVRYQRLGNMSIFVNNQSVEIGDTGKEDLSDTEVKAIIGR